MISGLLSSLATDQLRVDLCDVLGVGCGCFTHAKAANEEVVEVPPSLVINPEWEVKANYDDVAASVSDPSGFAKPSCGTSGRAPCTSTSRPSTRHR